MHKPRCIGSKSTHERLVAVTTNAFLPECLTNTCNPAPPPPLSPPWID